mmetsp:Transcript_58770/g.188988  ORF Transcript_58770/g.188988 Transcript_58770/m.188988 type:complete len:255 (+) Transcript_58770:194-958(+)
MPAKKDKKDKQSKPEAEVPEEDASSASEAEAAEQAEVPAKKAKNLFALMADDSEEEEEEEEPEEKKKKKKKPKASGDDDLAAMFGERKKKKKDGEKKEEKKETEKKKEKKPAPVACEVVEVAPVPKKDKLRLCKVRVGGGPDLLEIVTSAANIVAGKRFIVALPGVTTANGVEVKQAKVGGVESSGMFCGPEEMGWEADILGAKQAVMLSDTVELGAGAPTYEEAVQMHQERARIAAEKEKEQADSKGKKGKKK